MERFYAPAWSYWVLVALYAALIFVLSSLSHPDVYVPVLSIPYADKVLHALEYGLLGILTYRAFRYAAGPWSAAHAAFLAIVASTAYGLTDEFHQSFVPLRDANVWDLVADCIGAAVGTLGWTQVKTRRKPAEDFRESRNRV